MNHKNLINIYKNKFLEDKNLDVLLVTGSYARGEHKETSDLDLIAVGNYESKFEETNEYGITVEIKYKNKASFIEKMKKDPINCYQFLEARVIVGNEKTLTELQTVANQIINEYVPETSGIVKWLTSSKEKLAYSDEAKKSYIVSCNLWKLMEGLYVINKLPIPPLTNAYRNIKNLKILPVNFDQTWSLLLLGSVKERSEAWIQFVDFIIANSK